MVTNPPAFAFSDEYCFGRVPLDRPVLLFRLFLFLEDMPMEASERTISAVRFGPNPFSGITGLVVTTECVVLSSFSNVSPVEIASIFILLCVPCILISTMTSTALLAPVSTSSELFFSILLLILFRSASSMSCACVRRFVLSRRAFSLLISMECIPIFLRASSSEVFAEERPDLS